MLVQRVCRHENLHTGITFKVRLLITPFMVNKKWMKRHQLLNPKHTFALRNVSTMARAMFPFCYIPFSRHVKDRISQFTLKVSHKISINIIDIENRRWERMTPTILWLRSVTCLFCCHVTLFPLRFVWNTNSKNVYNVEQSSWGLQMKLYKACIQLCHWIGKALWRHRHFDCARPRGILTAPRYDAWIFCWKVNRANKRLIVLVRRKYICFWVHSVRHLHKRKLS